MGSVSSTGDFNYNITGLNPETSYYLWAFAGQNDIRTLGEPITFTTATANLPEVQTGIITNISPRTAEVEYSVLSDGGSSVTERGICWNTAQNPTIDQAHTNNGSGTGMYSSLMEDLIPATVYFVRAYAINSKGTAYGEQKEFGTLPELGEMVDQRDGKIYPTVQIGYQCWMAKNLNVGEMINGSVAATEDQIIQKYCFDNDPNNCNVFGGLYTWDEITNYSLVISQGICPEGWHIPSEEEWGQLELYLGMREDSLLLDGWRGEGIGNLLKIPGTEFWEEPNNGANNEACFNALGAGMGAGDGGFFALGIYTGFWTSDQDMWTRGLANSDSRIEKIKRLHGDRLSVRCVKD
jgi:uncharacterized protein (TIGR02145 family)